MGATRRPLAIAACVASLLAAWPSDAVAQRAGEDSVTKYGRALRAAMSVGDSARMAIAHNGLGLAHWQLDRYDSALVHLLASRRIREATGDSVGLGRVLNSIGSAHYQAGNYELALAAFLESLAYHRAREDYRLMAVTLSNVGKTYHDWGQLDRAESSLDEAVAYAERSGVGAVLGYALNSLGVVVMERGAHQEARVLFERSLAAYRSHTPPLSPSDSASGWALNALPLGRIDVAEGRVREGMARFETVLASARRGGTARGEATALAALAYGQRVAGRPGEAVASLTRALELSRSIGNRALALSVLADLATAEEARGNAVAALRHLRAHDALRDSIFDLRSSQRIAAMELEMEAERQRRETAALRVLEASQRVALARQRLVLALSVGLLSLAVALAVTYWRHHRQARDREAVLSRTNEELRAAVAEVRTLSGFIPICAHCKNVRDDQGYWQAVETYLVTRSDVNFSHAICNNCGPVLYGEDWEPPSLPSGKPPLAEPGPPR